MTRYQIINRLKNYFDIRELVGPKTYKRHGDSSWKFFRTEALHSLLIVREGIGKPMIVNNWHKGGKFTQRGLRTNLQGIFKGFFRRGILYLSAHVLGCGFDFDVVGMTANQVRKWIHRNKNLFPFKIRLERRFKGRFIAWVHLDTYDEPQNPKVYLFDV